MLADKLRAALAPVKARAEKPAAAGAAPADGGAEAPDGASDTGKDHV
jgi:hypothetical protein